MSSSIAVSIVISNSSVMSRQAANLQRHLTGEALDSNRDDIY
jgi:hypothetical protein